MDKHTIAHLKTVMSTEQLIDFLADQLAAAEKERDEMEMSLNVANDATGIWKGRAEAAEARLLVPVKLPSERFQYHESDYDDGHTAGWNSYHLEAIKEVTAAGYPVEGGE
ncbi:TPA: hypothetical protein ACPZRQ_003585 [Yersinia enterocolitica]